MKTIDIKKIYESYFGSLPNEIDVQTQTYITLQQLSLIISHLMNDDESLYSKRMDYYPLLEEELSVAMELCDYVLQHIEMEMISNELFEIVHESPDSNGIHPSSDHIKVFMDYLFEERKYDMSMDDIVRAAIGYSINELNEIAKKDTIEYWEVESFIPEELEVFDEEVLLEECKDHILTHGDLAMDEMVDFINLQKLYFSDSFIQKHYYHYMMNVIGKCKLLYSNISLN